MSRDLCFYVLFVHNFLAHFVQLVPFGQLGENFWGVGYAVKYLHVKIQNFIVNIYQNSLLAVIEKK